MARAKAIDDLNAERSYGEAAAKVIAIRSEELTEQARGVLDTGDIERVHDMRVASRRLRAVLEIFEPVFPTGDFKTVLRDVKALADALGERRDPDVHIEAMEQLEAAVQATNRPGIEALVQRQRARQAAGNAALAAALEQIREVDLYARLLSLADGAEEALQ